MKIYIRSSSEESYQLYRNTRNENKYIEVKKARDGHTYFRQFMYWNTDTGPVKNYSGSKTNRGRYHRVRLDTLDSILEDYKPVDDVHTEEDFFESEKVFGSIKSSEYIVTVGDVVDYYIDADNEEDALQEYLDLYAEEEDLEEYEADPSYIWVRPSDKVDSSDKIYASWPEELTYEDYDEGDQIIDVLLRVFGDLNIFDEPSARGGHGTDFFFNDKGEELGSIDLDEERRILEDMYFTSTSESDFEQKVYDWLADLCNIPR